MDLRQAVAITAVAIAPFASAQEADNWKGETELGVLITSGTTEETNIKGRLGLVHEVETWRNTSVAPMKTIASPATTSNQP